MNPPSRGFIFLVPFDYSTRRDEEKPMTDFRKQLKLLIRQAKNLGWEVTFSKHIKFTGPNGQIVIASSTSSCPFAIKKVAHDLKQAGLV